MSTDTNVFIGWYAVCTMSKVNQPEVIWACSENEKHKLAKNERSFCPECGAAAHGTQVDDFVYVSLNDVFYNNTEDLPWPLEKKDVNWLAKKFGPPVYSQDWEPNDGTEFVFMNGKIINVDSDPVMSMKHESFLKNTARPDMKDVDRLKKIMRYTDVKLKFGILITNT